MVGRSAPLSVHTLEHKKQLVIVRKPRHRILHET